MTLKKLKIILIWTTLIANEYEKLVTNDFQIYRMYIK